MSTRVFTSRRLRDRGEVSVGFLRVYPRIKAEKPLETPRALPTGCGHGPPALEVSEVSPQIAGISAHYKIGILTNYYYYNVVICAIIGSLLCLSPDNPPNLRRNLQILQAIARGACGRPDG
jgi:hypothetical protein